MLSQDALAQKINVIITYILRREDHKSVSCLYLQLHFMFQIKWHLLLDIKMYRKKEMMKPRKGAFLEVSKRQDESLHHGIKKGVIGEPICPHFPVVWVK